MQLSTRKASSEVNRSKAHKVCWKYARADFEGANELVCNIDIDDHEYQEGNIDQAWGRWEKHFMSVMHKCVPTVTAKTKKHPPGSPMIYS